MQKSSLISLPLSLRHFEMHVLSNAWKKYTSNKKANNFSHVTDLTGREVSSAFYSLKKKAKLCLMEKVLYT